ncbi:DUF4037 domain-containing protein [Pseudonocardia humida]|uniref:DUF4037 domain-containing protein n=1 Tax=Pseudonocardia humida TaxID=2800819 RepID=A0ABT1A9W1_9PSEU|nr:DUF4037 domain-containing protein [Pseudonocardia humida]MCO1659449.1 DUF4037 domain-containing protein [Pseudonocardia humida]
MPAHPVPADHPGRGPDAGFVPGRELSAAFHAEVVGPLLVGVPHSAALLGTGSDVLGYDTPVSTDHGWGPRMQVFVARERVDDVRRVVDAGLPERFRGWPVRFGWDSVPVRHHVQVAALDDWLRDRLGFDPADGPTTADWLTTPQQALLEVTAGAVHLDHDGGLRRAREALAWFPPPVHRWLLACQWTRIAQEEAFVGRTAQVGDELGSRLVAARLARELMRLAFLLTGRYWPYAKWFGTAFARLPVAAALGPALVRVLAAADLPAREAALVEAYGVVARAHNAAGLTEPVDTAVRSFHGRGFAVLDAGRFAAACRRAVADPRLLELPPVGSVDQFADGTDVLSAPGVVRRLRAVHDG